MIDAGSRQIEIIAVSGESRDAVRARLTEMDLTDDSPWPQKEFAAQAKRFRDEFNPEDFSRVLMVVRRGEPFGPLLHHAVAFLNDPEKLEFKPPAGVFYGEGKVPGKIAFLFPGQGSQYIGMGYDLVDAFPRAATVFDAIKPMFKQEQSLRRFIYPAMAVEPGEKSRLEGLLRQTEVAQPAIGAISLIMMNILSTFQVFPESAAGHSFGELSALCAGKRINETDFLSLSVWRGRLMADACGADKGQMLAVKAHPDAIEQLVKESGADVVVANKNSPEQGVLSGSSPEIEKMLNVCKEQRIRAMLLPVYAAFHSRMVSDAADGFGRKIDAVDILPESIPVYSNKTALPYPADAQEARRLLGTHLVSPVRFMDQINNMYDDGVRVFVEVGPKNVLTGLVNAILKGRLFKAFSIDASSGKQGGVHDLAAALCCLGAAGYPVDFRAW